MGKIRRKTNTDGKIRRKTRISYGRVMHLSMFRLTYTGREVCKKHSATHRVAYVSHDFHEKETMLEVTRMTGIKSVHTQLLIKYSRNGKQKVLQVGKFGIQ